MIRRALPVLLALIGGSGCFMVMDATLATTLPPITHLVVIHDTGNGIPVEAFVGTALKRLDESKNQIVHTEPVTAAPTMEQLLKLPLHSRLSPGVQPDTALPTNVANAMTQAMFIVGSDETSQQWLAQHEEWLFQRNAVGYLVQAETIADVDRMLAAAGRIPMAVISLDPLVGELSLRHYPVVITKAGIRHAPDTSAEASP